MKKIKVIIAIFGISCIMSALNVNAASLGFMGINVPGFYGKYTTESVTKADWGPQYARKNSAIDNVTSSERGIKARLTTGSTEWVTLPKGKLVQLDSGSIGESGDIKFQLELMHTSFSASSVSFYGMWYLDAISIA